MTGDHNIHALLHCPFHSRLFILRENGRQFHLSERFHLDLLCCVLDANLLLSSSSCLMEKQCLDYKNFILPYCVSHREPWLATCPSFSCPLTHMRVLFIGWSLLYLNNDLMTLNAEQEGSSGNVSDLKWRCVIFESRPRHMILTFRDFLQPPLTAFTILSQFCNSDVH
jgi:hypothetical protein